MLNKIEDLLFEKTQNKRSRIFHTQWGLAKEYIPQVLNLIAHTFPHYSLHDRTHSDTIINNIVRIIGIDSIEKFSAIDLWLLLCSAYYHDIGMVVTAHDKEKIFRDNNFVEFISEVQDDATSPFYRYAMNLKIDGGKIYYAQMELNAESYESSRFLMAEFIRWDHAKRSNESITNHESLNLPGDPISKRIIDLLGTICSSHTKSFDDIMNLSFCEVGIDTEDCHPRYIACLLRLGDLLDMDSNRFSNILLNTLSSIPIDSVQHQKKNLSITNLRIDKHKIEATATCKEPEVADLATKWFKLLDNEILDQMKRWSDIVPDISYGFLPTLGDLKVELANYDKIDGKIRPKFEIDPKKSIELLQGTGIYDSPFQSIRELLQNATDATYFRIYAESQLDEIEYTRDEFLDECKKYPIKIDIKKVENKITDNKNNKIQWEIKIADQGIGMSKDDLQYLIKTGSSSKNRDKVRMIKSMPEWMKPSGTFGIGFQSIFLITPSHQVNLITKKLNREATLYVELNNPLGENEGTVRVKTDRKAKVKTGTSISFTVEFEKIPEEGKYYRLRHREHVGKTLSEYDFIKGTTLDLGIAQIRDEISIFSKESYIPILLNNLDVLNPNLVRRNSDLDDSSEEIIKCFRAKENLEISIYKMNSYDNRLKIRYRNQIVSEAYLQLKFIGFNLNILDGNAKDVLTLDRNHLKSSFIPKINKNLLNAVLDILITHYDDFKSDKLKQYASIFIQYYNLKKKNPTKFTENEFSDWKNYSFMLEKNNLKETINLSDFFERYSEFSLTGSENYISSNLKIITSDSSINLFFIDDYGVSIDIKDFIIIKAVCELFYLPTIAYVLDSNDLGFYFQATFSKNNNKDLIANLEDWFLFYYKEITNARGLMPCLRKYLSLKLDDNYNPTCCCDNTFSDFQLFEYPKMICPYIVKDEMIEVDINDRLYDITYENRAEKSITKIQIEEAYKNFISDTKDAVKNANKRTLEENELILEI